jgi:polyhydroxyalkanoate synthesis regulator protein
MQALVPRYLEQSMAVFAQQQEQIRATMQRTMGNLFPFGNTTIEEVGRQNMAMIERALALFTPFYRAPESPQDRPVAGDEVTALRAEVETLKQQLANTRTPAPLAGVAEGAGRKKPERINPPELTPQTHESKLDP